MSSRWLPKPTLEGELLNLRPFTVDDAPAMAAVLADPEVLRGTGVITTSAQAAQYDGLPDDRLTQWYATCANADERLDLAIVDRATAAVVGEVVLNRFRASANSSNFRIVLGPAARGRGLGTEAARLMLGYGFDVLGLNRISLEVFASLPNAVRAYEKAGFLVEGIKREVFSFDGDYVDDVMMAILKSDWDAQ